MEIDNKDVQKPEGEGVSPSDTKTPVEVTSNDVKVELPVETTKEVKDVDKLQGQIDNLNKALREERESKKAGSEESNKRIEELQNSVEKYQDTITKLEGVFNPKQDEVTTEETPLTESQVRDMIQKSNEERQEQEQQKSKQELIRKEIKEMETSWDGKDGKPMYDDSDMIQWQKDNELLYLTPKQAFNERFHNEIIDYEAKKRMTGTKKVQDVETPSPVDGNHAPSEKEAPKTDMELRQEVFAAMEAEEMEM